MYEVAVDLETTRFHIAGMDCPDEIEELRRCLHGFGGITNLSFNLMQSTMTVAYDSARLDADRIIKQVATTGMTANIREESSPNSPIDAAQSRGPLRMTILAGCATAIGLAFSRLSAPTVFHTTLPAAVAYLLAIGAAWRYVAPKALTALRHGRLDMNVLMTIAVVGAIVLGEWFEASTIAFLFMVSNLLEAWSVTRARRAIHALMDLSPPQARVVESDGSERDVGVEQVGVGSRIIVRPGEKFPLDGRLADGLTTVDQSPITGESVPVQKAEGDEVFAGTINQDGAVVVNVTKPSSDTTLAGVIRLVEQAQSQRSRSEQFVERFARYYTPAVVVGAVLLCISPPLLVGASWATWIYRSLVLLVIACPCALVISTPVSIVSGLASAARNGVLIKGGEFLELVGRTKVIALDKTGTLTLGKPVVQQVIPTNNTSEATLLELAVAIEQRSEHPIAAAIVSHARKRGIKPPPCRDYQAIRGKGARASVDGQIYLLGNHRLLEENNLCTEQVHRIMMEHSDCRHTTVALASADKPLGVILLADGMRNEAAAALADLQRSGVGKLVMLTGDNTGTARSIAAECGGIDYRAELLPIDKVAAVTELRETLGHVTMVGDGINDAPALAAANVGIAMGVGGTDAALETADIALMTDDLRKLPWLLRHSRRTKAIIVQNISLALAIKAVFVVLAIPGLANLWMAIAADMGASLLVTFNGLRLLQSGSTTETRSSQMRA